MFEIEPILWLQAHVPPALGALLTLVTLLGYTPVYVVLLLTAGFGFRLRPSLAVLTTVLVAAVLFEAMKLGFALPRPDDVDARVRVGGTGPSAALVESGGAPSFWALPSDEAIAAVRARTRGSFGFPSGHVGAATAFLLAVARFFRSRKALVAAAVWVPLMALSRMYLGRHFLADVVGGLCIGVAAALLALPLVRALEAVAFDPAGAGAARLAFGLGLALGGLALIVPLLSPLYAGGLSAVVLTYALLRATGLPPDEGSERQRLARVAAAALFCSGGSALYATLLPGGSRAASLLAAGTITTATLIGPTLLARRLRLHG